jgi:uronate dehydrogenase
MLVTWLSYDDLTQLVLACLHAPRLGHTTLYGVSANRDKWWNNGHAAHIGYLARDSSEPFRAQIEALPGLDPSHPAARWQGGTFVTLGPFQSD